MKSLLLGAAGFIGTNLAIELAKNSENELTLVDRNKDYFKTIVKMNIGNINVMESNLTFDMDFDSILKGQDVVYHLVSTTVPTTSNQHISQELISNVIFSANLFEACIRCGVKKVVYNQLNVCIEEIKDKRQYDISITRDYYNAHFQGKICSYMKCRGDMNV